VRVDVLTIFPEYLEPLSLSLVGKARQAGLVDIGVHDLRNWTHDRHRSVDDAPFGGGAGMVMSPQPWGEALDALLAAEPAGRGVVPHLLVTSPSGRPLTQAWAYELVAQPWLVLACGRYEGIDARLVQDAAQRMPVEEVSVADVVLAGGEAAALVVVEAVVRLLPGVLGNPASLHEESHSDGLLEYPVYTRPSSWRGRDVPEVLRSGDHARIATWRREQSLRRTSQRRPDLLAGTSAARWSRSDLQVLAGLGWSVDPAGRLRPPDSAVAH
jgi:tRNA (guanine37-N1)-methyltransferase